MADPRGLHGVEGTLQMAQRPRPAGAGLLAREVFPGTAAGALLTDQPAGTVPIYVLGDSPL